MRIDRLRKKHARDAARERAAPARLAQFRADLAKAYPTLRGYAVFLTRNSARADDLVHDTCAKALEFEATFRPGTDFGKWLATIMLRKFFSDQKKGKREQEDPDQTLALSLPAPAYDLDAAIDAAGVMPFLFRIPSKWRIPLLRVALGDTYEEAAAALRLSVGTVKSRAFRGRAMLRNMLNAAGHEVPA